MNTDMCQPEKPQKSCIMIYTAQYHLSKFNFMQINLHIIYKWTHI